MSNQIKKMKCSICLRRISEVTKFQIDPCGHTFHKPCIDEWARQADSCPYCRGKLIKTNISNQRKRKHAGECLPEPKRRIFI